MAQNAFGLTSLYDPSIAVDQSALERQMALAQALRKSALTPIETAGRQVGGVGYKVSPWEGMAKALQAYQANRLDSDTDASRLELGKKQSAAMLPMLSGMLGEGGVGSPGAQPPAPVSEPGQMPPGPVPGPLAAGGGEDQNAKLKRAAMSAMLMGNTDLANKLIGNMMELTPEQKNMAATGQNPLEVGALRTAGLKKDALLPMTPGQSVYDPSENRQVFQAPENKPPEVRQLEETLKAAGIDPASPQGQAVFSQLAGKQVSHQPATTVSVNTEKGYSGRVAEGLATQDLAVIEAGKSAPERISSARYIKSALDKSPITGTGAEARLAITKALATAGIIDGKRVKSTEDLASYLAGGTLDAIKSSGLGSGQGFTDKDRQFLEKARSGNIEINSGTLRTLADLNERAATAAVTKANTIIKKLKTNPSMGGVGTAIDEIQVPGAVLRFDAQGNQL